MCAPEPVRVEDHLGLVYNTANALRSLAVVSTVIDYEDLVGDGCVGLVQAARAFDPSRGIQFSTFAVPRIRGAMLDGVRRIRFGSRDRTASEPVSLDAWLALTVEQYGDGDDTDLLRDDYPDWSPSSALDAVAEQEELEQLIAALPERERRIVALYRSGTSLRQAAPMFGLSCSRIDQLYQRASRRMRAAALGAA